MSKWLVCELALSEDDVHVSARRVIKYAEFNGFEDVPLKCAAVTKKRYYRPDKRTTL